MKRPLLALGLLLAALPPARADFDGTLAEATASLGAAAARAKARHAFPVTAGCVIEADHPIAAVNQDGRVPDKQRLPVDIRHVSPTRIEIRVEGLPVGAGPFPQSPYAMRLAGIMVSERDTPGYWLVGVVAKEMVGGGRVLTAWQTTSGIDEKSGELLLDLSRAGTRGFEAGVPAKIGRVQVKVTCSSSLP